MTPYRQVEADYSFFAQDQRHQAESDSLDRSEILTVLKSYFASLGMEAGGDSMHTMPITVLVNQLAMLCPFEAIEKQALLEAKDVVSRYRLLIDLMKMASHERPIDEDADLWTH